MILQSPPVLSQPTSPATQASPGDVTRLYDAVLIRAVRHHRRALTALREVTFEELSNHTTEKLLHQLSRDLRTFEAELERRGLEV